MGIFTFRLSHTRMNTFMLANKQIHISTTIEKYNHSMHGAIYVVRTSFYVLHMLAFLQIITIMIFTRYIEIQQYFFQSSFLFPTEKQQKNIHYPSTQSKNYNFLNVCFLFYLPKIHSQMKQHLLWLHMRHTLAHWTKNNGTSVIKNNCKTILNSVYIIYVTVCGKRLSYINIPKYTKYFNIRGLDYLWS